MAGLDPAMFCSDVLFHVKLGRADAAARVAVVLCVSRRNAAIVHDNP